jgi:hypothetical protein
VSEIPKRLAPRFETFRELFLKSGNLCAYSNCDAPMMTEDGVFVGQLCHIEAAEPGGERFNPTMTNEDRRSASNLMLMCYPHHRQTNDVERYSAANLKRMKAAHERRFSRPDRAMRERAARLNWATLVGAGLVAGLSFGGIVEQLRSLFDALRSPPNEPGVEPKPLRKELEQGLRYAPRGTVYCYSRDPLHIATGDLFLEIFESQGWVIERMDKPLKLEGAESPDFGQSMLMAFAVKDQNQLPIARQAVDEFFDKCGFAIEADTHEAVGEKGSFLIRFYIPVVARPR